MVIPIVFVVLGGYFVYSTIMSLMKLFNTDFDKQAFDAKLMFSVFKAPLICFALLTLFIIFGIPFFEANGIK